MRKASILLLLVLCSLIGFAQNRKQLPNANAISMFMEDSNVDVNENYVVNYFVGELSRFLSYHNIKNRYNTGLEEASNGWYMMISFSGRTTLSWNGVYKYEYHDVGLYVTPADRSRSNEGYWIYLGNFTVGTQPGDLLKYFKSHIRK